MINHEQFECKSPLVLSMLRLGWSVDGHSTKSLQRFRTSHFPLGPGAHHPVGSASGYPTAVKVMRRGRDTLDRGNQTSQVGKFEVSGDKYG